MLDWLNEQESLRSATRQIISEAVRVDIAVAFWGANPLKRLPLSANRVPLTRIIANVMSGGTNPAAIRDLLAEFGSDRVRQLNNLHAKVFLSDAHLIVGSANVSVNGLGLEGDEQKGWREVCVRTNDPSMMQAAVAWFEVQWNASSRIVEADLLKAEEAWKRARIGRPFVRQASDSQGMLAYPLETLRGRRLFISVTSQDASSKAVRILAEKRKSEPSVDGYEEWPDMPLDAILLASGLDRTLTSGRFSVFWDGFWETPEDEVGRSANTFHDLTLVRPPHSHRVLQLSERDCKVWERDIKALCRLFRDKPKLLPNDQSWAEWCLPIEDAWVLLSELIGEGKLTESRRSSSSTNADSANSTAQGILATVGDDAIRAAIAVQSAGGKTFRTTDLIRRLAGGASSTPKCTAFEGQVEEVLRSAES